MQMPSGKTWYVGGTLRRPLCLRQSERGGEREEGRARRGWGRSCRTLWAMGRTWALTPQGDGSPGGLWAEEGCGLTRVLTGALCRKDRLVEGGGLVMENDGGS